MENFKREEHEINGVKAVVYVAGEGEPLLFFHGAGTFHGFEFAQPWIKQFKVILPYHPGYGESGDDPAMNSMDDYVLHYLDLLDVMGIDKVNLVGFSLGGFMAAKFASSHPERVRKLVLVAPAGLRDDKHPMADVLALPPEKLLPMLASNFDVVARHLPPGPDLDFMGERYREAGATARLLWERPWDPKLPRYLHRAKMPVALVWGDEDQLIPVGQIDTWKKYLQHAEVKRFAGAGHLVLDEKPEAVKAVAEFCA
jgi:pimeloyl-ACP methyl ester carboxylesterase